MVGENECVAAAVEFGLDRLEDFAVKRVHHVMHDDADNAGTRRPEAGSATVVDITECACLLFDLFARISCDERAVPECQ
ncbi:hypothetical protein D3C73_673440 [compost metagenome]